MRALALLLALQTAPAAEDAVPVQVFYDPDNARGAWGQSNGLGLLLRVEEGREVCHVLFFGEGLEILEEKRLPVARGKGTVTLGEVACGWDEEARTLVLPHGTRLKEGEDGETVRTALAASAKLRYLLTGHLSAEALAEAEAKDAPKDEAGLWSRLKGTDYVLDHGFAGQGLRFFEDEEGRKCLVVTFGSGRPVVGRKTVPVILKGNEVLLGERSFLLDPASLSLTETVPGRKGKPAFPDRGILRSMLKAAAHAP